MRTRPLASPPPAAASAPGVVSLRRRLLPAALLALGLGIAAVAWLTRLNPEPGVDAAERLSAAARTVAARAPQAWRGLEPLSPSELAAPAFSDPLPGVPAIVAPQGRVIDGRPRTRWGGVAPGATVEIRVCAAGGAACWTRTGQGGVLDYPPEERELPPGPHEITLRLLPDGAPMTRGFEVATPDQRQALAAATGAVNAHAPRDLRPLLRGHASARLGFLLEAEARAQEALSADSKNAAALDLLRHVHASIGETEGWRPRR
jgi:hypothetical protein